MRRFIEQGVGNCRVSRSQLNSETELYKLSHKRQLHIILHIFSIVFVRCHKCDT